MITERKLESGKYWQNEKLVIPKPRVFRSAARDPARTRIGVQFAEQFVVLVDQAFR
jgi:hypothetical protein